MNDLQVNFLKLDLMETDELIIQTETFMLENGKMEREKEKENTHIMKEVNRSNAFHFNTYYRKL